MLAKKYFSKLGTQDIVIKCCKTQSTIYFNQILTVEKHTRYPSL